MLLRSALCLSFLLASNQATAIPDLPEPVSNNAVASTTVRGKTYVLSAMGMGPGKQATDIHNKVWMHSLGEFNWAEMPPVPSQQRLNGRIGASAIALNNNFFIFGGASLDNNGQLLTANDSYRFDPITRRYTKLNDMPVPVNDAAIVSYQNRYIYLISGWSDHGNVNLVQLFDNFTQRWSQATPFPGKPVFGLAAAIHDNIILVCDGVSIDYPKGQPRQFVMEPACWQANIGSNANQLSWQQVAHPTGQGRFRMAASTVIVNNKPLFAFIGGSHTPYIANGIGFSGKAAEPDSAIWLYSPTESTWLDTQSGSAVIDLTGAVELNGLLYTLGGMQSGQQVINKPISHQINLLPN
ncbi:Kelch repeat-containing protein [Arsukibacterium sp.]|uniref:Kelch repeat-containing protein n=1 Tax=Arsukibacterium sp. TaxID=1977258 RepID=UPI002FD8E438